MIMYGLVVLLVFIGAIIWGVTAYRHHEEEFTPSAVKNFVYDKKSNIMSFVGARTGKVYAFIGSCTVWHDMNGHRLDVFMERRLSDIYHYWQLKKSEE